MHKSVEEFSVKTIEVCGFRAAEKALRLPFGNNNAPKETDPVYFSLSKNDRPHTVYCSNLDLMSKLVKRGDEHAKVLRGVMVWCEINAPLYWWKEADTYRVGAERLSSESSMHIQGRGLDEDELIELQETMPLGHMQKRVWMFSYQTLRRIYFQRRNHRLPQWRMFCDWIKTLPFSDDLITIDGTGDNKD